jgi:hypothetical protein
MKTQELINAAAFYEMNRNCSDEMMNSAIAYRNLLAMELQKGTRKSELTALREANKLIRKAIFEIRVYGVSIYA